MSEDMKNQEMQAKLAAALEAVDPMPEAALDAAKAVFTWRTIDAELASLVFDSSTEELVGVRSAEATRQLTFSTPGVEIELVVLSETSRRIVGQLVPPQQAEITLQHESGSRTVTTDGLGRFTIHDVPAGAVRLTCRLEDESGAIIQTEWTLI